ncbi:MAG TPA: hypothetical protein VGD58_18215 [Herpetosiphonaceae bacterium]
MKRLLILCLPLLVLLLPAQTQGQTTNRAGIVVKFSDGRVQTSCVSFQTESISGLDLLQRTGLDVIAQSSGGSAAVCKIGGDGCAFPAEPCFCKFGGGQQGQYWAYWRLNGDAWRYSGQGASGVRVTNGDVDGWAWGTGNVQSGAAPPVTTFDQICPAVQPEPVQPAPEPTAKPAPEPTAVPAPRPTIAPTARPTAVPTIAPTARPTAQPTARPTAPVVAEAPTSTIVPPTTTPSPELPTATALPTSTATITPTATAAPSTTPTATSTSAATPTAADPTPTPVAATSGSSNLGSYLIFGTMLAGLVGAIGVAQWRRRR